MTRTQVRAFIVMTLFLVVYGTWKHKAPPPEPPAQRTTPSAWSAPGAFRLAEAGTASAGSRRFVATDGPADTCRFEIQIAEASPAKVGPGGFARATLARHPASDCTAYLKRLAPSLGFKGDMPAVPPVKELEVVVSILGRDLSKAEERDGLAAGFSSTPRGNWLVTKVFLADGDGEVFLNLNTQEGVGEFSVKDVDHATKVVTELAKLLRPTESSSPPSDGAAGRD